MKKTKKFELKAEINSWRGDRWAYQICMKTNFLGWYEWSGRHRDITGVEGYEVGFLSEEQATREACRAMDRIRTYVSANGLVERRTTIMEGDCK